MSPYPARIAASLLWLGLTLSINAAPLRVLYFTKSSGFEHSVVKRTDGQPSYSEKILTKLGAEHDLAFTFTKDGSLFTFDYLANFDVLLFYTSGDLLSVGTDAQPAMTADGKQALLDAVSGGKGFVGLHSCSDTFHTSEKAGVPSTDRLARFRHHGDASDPFIKMLGGEFIRHGPQQMARARVLSPKFPGMESLGDELHLHEEWYSLKEFAPDLHALLLLETNGMTGSDYQRPPFPIAWARAHGNGRVVFNALGHREDVWDNPQFQSMVLGAIRWSGKRLDADITPNLALVAPDHATLPPPPPEKK
ncbi:hypothetical protein CMV30_15520 [Nibricoccus aquaticus]|uniref:ThuA-like domain-containing protein n=1 Tax=Nibricoccus aquaticus TaxID=2576891 RepID=A0A290QIT7_9BACT|nr:ThuA domain-containing protein [Nibricoccus aquaticus]ATC65248.1 hypothetical protein CMV30_15520 [Nibricoccus aquaticus]